MPTDADLLRRYVEDHSEAAFAELVQRHLNSVYAAAMRRTGGRHALAEEITQQVFTDLARKAARLLDHPTLTGWLHRGTGYAAIDAFRAECRRQKLATAYNAMPDDPSPTDHQIDWEHLRPVIDEALDQLKERDRELMLLRFFQGLPFAEVGARLDLTENAARMRAERALDQLRYHLGKRGVTSSAAVLTGLFANQSLIAAPPGLAATVTTASLAASAAGSGATGIVSFIFMSKLTAPTLGAAIAASLTGLVWTSVAESTSSDELASLRSEHSRLSAATAAGAPPESVAAVADEYTAQAIAIAQAVSKRSPSPAAPPAPPTTTRTSTRRGHRDHGQATARDALLSFPWACDAGDTDALAKLLWFDGQGRDKALAVLAAMPASIRAEYRTPEELYAFFLVADTLLHPPPGGDFVAQCELVDAGAGRVSLRRPGCEPDRYHQYQNTPEGWKFVIPEPVVERMPQVLNSETLHKLSGS